MEHSGVNYSLTSEETGLRNPTSTVFLRSDGLSFPLISAPQLHFFLFQHSCHISISVHAEDGCPGLPHSPALDIHKSNSE